MFQETILAAKPTSNRFSLNVNLTSTGSVLKIIRCVKLNTIVASVEERDFRQYNLQVKFLVSSMNKKKSLSVNTNRFLFLLACLWHKEIGWDIRAKALVYSIVIFFLS